jgi:hypothetical protein
MAATDMLSVRLSPEARRALDEAAAERGVAGASALAREILEHWATERRATQARAGVQRAVSYLRANPDGWYDEPADFFPGAIEPR